MDFMETNFASAANIVESRNGKILLLIVGKNPTKKGWLWKCCMFVIYLNDNTIKLAFVFFKVSFFRAVFN